MKFLDEAKIYVKAGDGGHGLCSFRREKFLEYGGPNGGNGGKGGDVFFKAVPNLNTLIDFRYQQHFKAQNGQRGGSASKTGASGEDLVVSVPTGTVILADDRTTVLVDMDTDGKVFKIARGGKGGRGNESYKTSTNQAPRQADPGEEGEELTLWLSLKVIADVGLLGLPNAGKSTFLSCISRAKPKIADYPFTTLHPQLGVVAKENFEFVVADIPGIIEGASEGVGLGIQFLKHLERCKIVLHLIDATSEHIKEEYKTVRQELQAFSQELAHKQEIVVLTKADALSEEEMNKKVKMMQKWTKKPVYPLSSVANKGVEPVLEALGKLIYGEEYETF